MSAEKHKSIFFYIRPIRLSHGTEEFQYNENDLQVLPQGTEFNTFTLTRKVLGFEQAYMCGILVTGPLGTSECAGKCRFSANLCKRSLHATAGFIVEATRNADILTITANAL